MQSTHEASLLPLERGRSVLTGVTLPDPPPTRVYISGRLYRLSPSPTIPLPPLINTIKVIANWVLPAGRLAKNVYYLKAAGGTVTSDVPNLLSIANQLMSAYPTGGFRPLLASTTQLQSVTCKDNGGTTAQAISTATPMFGTSAGTSLPPQCAVCLSWQIAETYRGGKPRMYLPGIPDNAPVSKGDSALQASYATAMEAAGSAFRTAVNAIVPTGPVGATVTLGTISYHTGHAVRPTPLFREYINVAVHERIDSQRRRSGRESAFGVIP